jgi:hypothetical protein
MGSSLFRSGRARMGEPTTAPSAVRPMKRHRAYAPKTRHHRYRAHCARLRAGTVVGRTALGEGWGRQHGHGGGQKSSAELGEPTTAPSAVRPMKRHRAYAPKTRHHRYRAH